MKKNIYITSIITLFIFFGIITACQKTPLTPNIIPNPNNSYKLADTMIAANGYTNGPYSDPQKAINGVFAGENDVYSLNGLGSNNFIILSWSNIIITNGVGDDLVVFENPFSFEGNSVFMEQAVVAVSYDNSNWVEFPYDYTFSNENIYSTSPDHWIGFAGVTPVLFNANNNNVDVFNKNAAGGDSFNIDDLPNTTNGIFIKENGFRYIKITAATAFINSDTGSNFVYDSGNIYSGPDIDGVYGRYPSIH